VNNNFIDIYVLNNTDFFRLFKIFSILLLECFLGIFTAGRWFQHRIVESSAFGLRVPEFHHLIPKMFIQRIKNSFLNRCE